jgi:hypothetical protein
MHYNKRELLCVILEHAIQFLGLANFNLAPQTLSLVLVVLEEHLEDSLLVSGSEAYLCFKAKDRLLVTFQAFI